MFELIVSNTYPNAPSTLSLIPTVAPAIAIVVATAVAAISYVSVKRQWAHNRLQLEISHWEERSDAIRSKRATAKSLRQEILTIKALIERGSAPEPIVFGKLVDELGRLSTRCIETVIDFHFEYGIWTKLEVKLQPDSRLAVIAAAERANIEIDRLLGDTRRELDQAKSEIDRRKFQS